MEYTCKTEKWPTSDHEDFLENQLVQDTLYILQTKISI